MNAPLLYTGYETGDTHPQTQSIVLAYHLGISTIKRASNAHIHMLLSKVHTCDCSPFHLIYQLSIVKWHMYIVRSVHSAYIGMQCMGCYRIQTMSMHVGITLTYCVMYCTYRQCHTLLYVIAHKLLLTDLYSVLYLLILFVDSSNSTKVLFAFLGIFHISYSLIIDAICF